MLIVFLLDISFPNLSLFLNVHWHHCQWLSFCLCTPSTCAAVHRVSPVIAIQYGANAHNVFMFLINIYVRRLIVIVYLLPVALSARVATVQLVTRTGFARFDRYNWRLVRSNRVDRMPDTRVVRLAAKSRRKSWRNWRKTAA